MLHGADRRNNRDRVGPFFGIEGRSAPGRGSDRGAVRAPAHLLPAYQGGIVPNNRPPRRSRTSGRRSRRSPARRDGLARPHGAPSRTAGTPDAVPARSSPPEAPTCAAGLDTSGSRAPPTERGWGSTPAAATPPGSRTSLLHDRHIGTWPATRAADLAAAYAREAHPALHSLLGRSPPVPEEETPEIHRASRPPPARPPGFVLTMLEGFNDVRPAGPYSARGMSVNEAAPNGR